MKELLINLFASLAFDSSINTELMNSTYKKVLDIPYHKLSSNPYIEPIYVPTNLDLVFLENGNIGILYDDYVFYVTENGNTYGELLTQIKVRMFGRMQDNRGTNLVKYHYKSFVRYSKVKDTIKEAAEQEDVPEELLATVLYSESKFNNNAKSWTGVTGIAMLTSATAKRFNVDKSSVRSQIMGMARVIKYNFNKISSEDYSTKERYKLAAFCYNRGMKHYFLARKSLRKNGKSLSYKSTMNRLSKWKYCKEGFTYVNRISTYNMMFRVA